MTHAAELVLYTGLLMGVTMGLTAYRLASPRGRVSTQVDGMLGFCLLGAAALLCSALLPGAQLP